jgi:phage terminase small subunit
LAGRIPKPTALKEITGNPGTRPLNKQEPRPEGEAEKPKFLKGRASKIWDEYAPALTKLGILTSIDAHQFAAYCALASEFEKDTKAMTASRIAQMRALASSFGMDSSSRSRLSISPEKPNHDPADKYLNAPITGPGNSLRQ